MKIHRQLEIITLLLKRKTIPAKEFAGRFAVSMRTIYRDIEDLSAAGIPVYMNKGKGGGISLLDTLTFDRTLISGQESDSLLLALKTLQATQYPEIDRVLNKLETLFNQPAADQWVQVEFSPWGSKPNAENKFVEIKHAILKLQLIFFDYIDARGEKSQRLVEPMQLIFKSQSWYLRGYCQEKQDFRTFRLSRIKNLKVTGLTFKRRDDIDAEPEKPQTQPKDLVTVRLRFSNEVTHRVYDDFSDELIVKNADGSCLVTVALVEDEWVYSLILSYGCFVEVVEPDHIRSIVAARLKKSLAFYE